MDAARQAQESIGHRTYEQFLSNIDLRQSIYWSLMTVGEALNQAVREEPNLRTQLPQLSNIVGMRNRMVHAYGKIDNDVIWKAVQEWLPELIDVLGAILANRSTTEPPRQDPG